MKPRLIDQVYLSSNWNLLSASFVPGPGQGTNRACHQECSVLLFTARVHTLSCPHNDHNQLFRRGITLPDMKIDVLPEDSPEGRTVIQWLLLSLCIFHSPLSTHVSHLALPVLLYIFLGYCTFTLLVSSPWFPSRKSFLIPSSSLSTCLKRFQSPQDLKLT